MAQKITGGMILQCKIWDSKSIMIRPRLESLLPALLTLFLFFPHYSY